MFDSLTDRLTTALRRFTGRGRLSKEDVEAGLREVRVALLEADVNFRVARAFVDRVRERAVGSDVLESLTPGQQIVKIVAGELTALLDDALLEELKRIRQTVRVNDTVLVVDSMTGQEAVNVGRGFEDAVGVDGVILTKLDGDARGGAALSMRETIGKPIMYSGTGEKLSDLEPFAPD